ncbi:MAG: ureidoglycolate lyase [Hyphomicrobiaceae bacterium]
MLATPIDILPLTGEAFAPFGDILEIAGEPSFQINRGMCDRFHDVATLDFVGPGARSNISFARSRPYALPLTLDMVERHPLGSQAFIPLSAEPFLVVVAADEDGRPQQPLAFLTAPGQGVNYHRGVWHGVLTPLGQDADFVIVDRVGDGDNLEEFYFDRPYVVGPDMRSD